MLSTEAQCHNIHDLRLQARRRLPRGIFDFVDLGTEDQISIRNNRSAFERMALCPRVLRDVSARDISIDLFGKPSALPLVVAPTGAAGLLWHDGEIALARAAAAANVPFTLSTASITSIERVADEAGGRLWFQLYMWPDVRMSHQLVERVKKAGFEALVVTVDTAVTPNREYNRRNGFAFPFTINRRNMVDVALHPRWLATVMGRYLLTSGMPKFENFPDELRRSLLGLSEHRRGLPKNDSLRWEDLRTLRSIWDGPLIVKGILHPEDASSALSAGADGVVVSNHGGRNLDGSCAPIDMLAAVAERVGSRMTVMVDSGFVRGTDVAKALALGAHAVMVGRAPLWGVAAFGERGAARALTILGEEIERTIAQLGLLTPGALSRDAIRFIAGEAGANLETK